MGRRTETCKVLWLLKPAEAFDPLASEPGWQSRALQGNRADHVSRSAALCKHIGKGQKPRAGGGSVTRAPRAGFRTRPALPSGSGAPLLPPLVLHLPRCCGREAAGGTSPDPATAPEPSAPAGRGRKRGSKSPGKDEELGGGKPKRRSLPCPGSPLGPVPRSASAAGLGRAGSWPRSRPRSRPLPLPARLAGTCRPPAAAASSSRCRDTSIPCSYSFPSSHPVGG